MKVFEIAIIILRKKGYQCSTGTSYDPLNVNESLRLLKFVF